MPRPSALLADALARRYRSLEATRINVERLRNQGLVCERDVEHTYEGLFLNLYVAFESFLENLFLGLLVEGQGLISSRRDIVPRVKVRSHKIAWELIVGTKQKKYVDWLPYSRTITLANLYFRGGRPFTALTDSQQQVMKRSCVIRNAIAHRSRYSIQQFDIELIGNSNLPHREKKPVGYLRGLFRVSPKQTRFENFAAQLLLIARVLAQ